MNYGPMFVIRELAAQGLENGLSPEYVYATLKPYLVPEFEEEQI